MRVDHQQGRPAARMQPRPPSQHSCIRSFISSAIIETQRSCCSAHCSCAGTAGIPGRRRQQQRQNTLCLAAMHTPPSLPVPPSSFSSVPAAIFNFLYFFSLSFFYFFMSLSLSLLLFSGSVARGRTDLRSTPDSSTSSSLRDAMMVERFRGGCGEVARFQLFSPCLQKKMRRLSGHTMGYFGG